MAEGQKPLYILLGHDNYGEVEITWLEGVSTRKAPAKALAMRLKKHPNQPGARYEINDEFILDDPKLFSTVRKTVKKSLRENGGKM